MTLGDTGIITMCQWIQSAVAQQTYLAGFAHNIDMTQTASKHRLREEVYIFMADQPTPPPTYPPPQK